METGIILFNNADIPLYREFLSYKHCHSIILCALLLHNSSSTKLQDTRWLPPIHVGGHSLVESLTSVIMLPFPQGDNMCVVSFVSFV